MPISYDPLKSERNLALRGLSFERAPGWIDGRLTMLVFTPRGGVIHVNSLRKANAREANRYAEQVDGSSTL